MKMHTVVTSLLMVMIGILQPASLIGQSDRARWNRGAVVLNFEKSITQGDARTLSVVLSRAGFAPLKKSTPAKLTTIRFDDVVAGDWIVSARAENRSGIGICSGTSTVSVGSNRTTTGTITFIPALFGFTWTQERIKWKMHAANPVLEPSEEGWDSEHYYFDDPTIVKRDGVYHMWYSSAENLRGNETFWIAYATSPDGIAWTKHGSVLGPGAGGRWMAKGASGPTVIDDQGVFKMWFVGENNPYNYHHGIGYATSRDGTTWEVDVDPVLPTNASLAATWHPAVLKKDALYYLFTGVTTSPNGYPMDIALFTSTDGRTWQGRGKVLSARREKAWQSSGIAPCEVIFDGNRFKMFFTGFEAESFSIGYAESQEGINWIETLTTSLMGPADTAPWSTKGVGFPAVLMEDGKLKMWFSALTEEPRRYQIGYAEESK
jgi:predicted GH43/DUF377 family glycosyl hydrolase